MAIEVTCRDRISRIHKVFWGPLWGCHPSRRHFPDMHASTLSFVCVFVCFYVNNGDVLYKVMCIGSQCELVIGENLPNGKEFYPHMCWSVRLLSVSVIASD